LVFCGGPLYHLPLPPEVAPDPGSPGRSLRPGRLLPDQRRRGAPGAVRLVRGFPPAGRGRNRKIMKIILADDVRGLGHRGETVTVKPGYARNFLFPQGVAYEATTANVQKLSEQKKKYDEKTLREKGVASEVASKVEGLTIVIVKKAGDEGHLYGSVTASEIADALAAKGIEVDRRRVELAEPIRRLGTHTVHVRLHRDVAATLNVEVQATGTPAA